jgi:hypothetical protein
MSNDVRTMLIMITANLSQGTLVPRMVNTPVNGLRIASVVVPKKVATEVWRTRIRPIVTVRARSICPRKGRNNNFSKIIPSSPTRITEMTRAKKKLRPALTQK